MQCLGTAKKNLLEQITEVLPDLGGISIVFYPQLPGKMHRQTVMSGGANEAAVGANDVHMSGSDSDSDVDASIHDFTSDGVLPEAITSMHLVKKPQERAAQLAAITMRSVPW